MGHGRSSTNGTRQVDVVVVGGGLAGFAAAATAARAGRSVLLLDGHPGANRAATETVGRFRFNKGAHALYRRGAARPVLGRLGVTVSGSRPPIVGGRGRRGDVVDRLPLDPVSVIRTRLVSARGVARLGRVLAGLPRWRPAELADRTAAAWFDDLGLDGDERQVVEMLARTATYVADLDTVSADLVALQVGLAVRGNVEYLDGGWQTLLDGLAAAGARAGVERVGDVARSVVPEGRRVTVVTGGQDGEGGTVLAGAVVLATGTPEAMAALLPERPAAWAGLAGPVHAACLELGLAAPPPVRVLLGLDRPLYLICHAPPARLAPPGAAVVHGLRYLHAGEAPPPGEARADLEAHARLAGIDPAGAEESRYRHRMVTFGALPTPATGGLAGRPGPAGTGLDGVFVAGDWLGPDGHLADAALSTGETAGRLAAERAAAATRAPAGGLTQVAGD
ncbi:MAG TPA: NAD(P)-binding protein [Acidimicrobiales bacterium]|nr:NAD(P)-binding protein [Acidimicrobiales bacterium]